MSTKHRDTAGQERYKASTLCYDQPTLELIVCFSSHSCVILVLLWRLTLICAPHQAPMYYRNAHCAVVVYDITQSASLEKARTWIRELQRQADPSIVIALCGNKSDLAARRQVSQEEAKKYADEEGLMWTETSAKTGEGVVEIFTEIGGFYYIFLIAR